MEKKHRFKRSSKETYIRAFVISSIILLISITILVIKYHFESIDNETQTCYNTLLDSTAEASSKIESSFKNDIVNLRMLSKVIAKCDDLKSEDVNNQLTAYAVNSYITNIAIITQDDEIIQTRYKNIYKDRISFDEEIVKGEHTSSLQKSLFSDKLIIRNYVPVNSRQNQKAILFTEIDPATLARIWTPGIYDGKAEFCIVDKNTGQILMSTLDGVYSNLSDLHDTIVTTEVMKGEIDYHRITMNNKKYLAAYRPMDIENWEIMFFVEEDYVTQPLQKMQSTSYVYLTIGSIIFTAYLVWTIIFSLQAIKKTKAKANIDALTGLENRNNYEEFCYKAKNTDGLTCIYIDVNGLHTINNERGHLAGDMMLRYIAETLKIYFEGSNIYRIGGDEFIVFNHNDNNEEFIEKAYTDIRKNDYHIAYGIKTGYPELHISDLIKQAETLMYEMKSKYYESIGQPVRNQMQKET